VDEVLKELNEYNKENSFSLKVNKNGQCIELYRGISKKDPKMIKNSTGSWNCFTSVSFDNRIAA
jgi:hypothetical protein